MYSVSLVNYAISNAQIAAEQQIVKIVLSNGSDSLSFSSGTTESFWVNGRAGSDYISFGAGNDTGFGGDDNDHLRGRAGNDSLDGGAGDDELEGDAGSDILFGGAGMDELNGGTGATNRLNGGSGNDILESFGLYDVLQGAAGYDELYYGGPGYARLFGGEQNDWLTIDNQGSGELDGGGGDDEINFGVGTIATGGAGSDLFMYSSLDNGSDIARIRDFSLEDGDSLYIGGYREDQVTVDGRHDRIVLTNDLGHREIIQVRGVDLTTTEALHASDWLFGNWDKGRVASPDADLSSSSDYLFN